jgi:hypothetical protein
MIAEDGATMFPAAGAPMSEAQQATEELSCSQDLLEVIASEKIRPGREFVQVTNRGSPF